MPAARANDERRRVGLELVVLARDRVGEVDLASPEISEVDLAFEVVGPGRGIRILEVGHEDLRAGVQRVDDHLAVDRPGDFHAAIKQIGGDWRDLPVAGADGSCFGKKIGEFAGIEFRLPDSTRGEQFLAATIERALEAGDEGQGLIGQDFLEAGGHLALDLDASHTSSPSVVRFGRLSACSRIKSRSDFFARGRKATTPFLIWK